MFGMHKRTQGMHLQLHLTTHEKKTTTKKNKTSPFTSAILLMKQSAWIGFTACVVLLLLLSIYQKGRHTQKAKPVQGVRLQKTNIHIPTVHYKLNSTQQNTKQ